MADDVRTLAARTSATGGITLLAGRAGTAGPAASTGLGPGPSRERRSSAGPCSTLVPETREIFTRPGRRRGPRLHGTIAVPPPAPPARAAGRRHIGEAYLRWFFERWTYRPAIDDRPDYVQGASRPPGALRASFDATGPPSPTTWRPTRPAPPPASACMPVLALWGETGLPSRLPVATSRRFAMSIRGQPIKPAATPPGSRGRSSSSCWPSSKG